MSEALELTSDLEAMMASLQHSLLIKYVYMRLHNTFLGTLVLKHVPQMKQTAYKIYFTICMFIHMNEKMYITISSNVRTLILCSIFWITSFHV